MSVAIPRPLVDSCNAMPERIAWLSRLPALIEDLARRWSLSVQYRSPFEGSCAWVAPATRADDTPVVLKVIMPHMEAEHEIDGLRFWAGNPTVNLLEADDAVGALLVERCYPGTSLRAVSEHEQDHVIAGLLRRMWRRPGAPSVFRPLSFMMAHWSRETRADTASWPDASLVQQGLSIFEKLAAPTDGDVLLATDIHAGNVLSAEREPWLVIDPKPFIGDRAFDATQHLSNCKGRLRSDPMGTVEQFADLLGVDHERIRLWLFARVAAEPRASWDQDSVALARLLKVQQ
jgi:streptomycin 6-kinase